jgi:S1-C subfamily serine protease
MRARFAVGTPEIPGQVRFPLTDPRRDFITLDPIPPEVARSIIPLVEMHATTPGAEVIGIGTAFVIGRVSEDEALLVTAAHNITKGVRASEDNLVALFPRDDTPEGLRDLRGFIISGVSLAESSSDLALMVVTIDSNVTPPGLLPISFRSPIVGEKCVALGYPEIVIGRPTELNSSAVIKLSSTRGSIEEIHPSRRDGSMITFPSFRTNALCLPGMSGGPVIDPSCFVIGVISAGMQQSSEPDLPHLSYCSLLAALFELNVPVEGAPLTLTQLSERGAVIVDTSAPMILTREGGELTAVWPEPVDAPEKN